MTVAELLPVVSEIDRLILFGCLEIESVSLCDWLLLEIDSDTVMLRDRVSEVLMEIELVTEIELVS